MTENIGRHEGRLHRNIGRSADDPLIAPELGHRKSSLTIHREEACEEEEENRRRRRKRRGERKRRVKEREREKQKEQSEMKNMTDLVDDTRN